MMWGRGARFVALVRGDWRRLPLAWVGRATAALYITKTALAAGLAWQLAVALGGHARPYFAPLAVVLVMQVTVRESYVRAVQRVLGVMAGVLVAYLLGRWLGVDAWSIALVIFASLALGRLLRLSPTGAVQVPVSALLVMVVGASQPGYGWDRIVDTAIGAAVAVGVNLLILPPTHVEQVREAVAQLATRLGRLWLDMGRQLPQAVDPSWLERARGLAQDVAGAREALTRAREAVWWNPAARPVAAELPLWQRRLDALEHLVIQARGLNRSLEDAVRADPGVLELLAPEARLLVAVGDLLVELGRRAAAGRSDWDDLKAPLEQADAAHRQGRLDRPPERGTLAPAAFIAAGGVMAVSRRIVDELTDILAPASPAEVPAARPVISAG